LVLVNAATLRDLLQQAVDKRLADGLSAGPRELERLVEAEESAHPRGLSLNRTTASQILRGTYKGSSSASDGTIRAVGWLAGVSDEVAFAAAGRRIPGPPFAMELPPGVDDLSPKERRAAIEILRALVAQRQEINRYVDSTADSAASTGTPGQASEDQEVVTPLRKPKPAALPQAARDVGTESEGRRRRREQDEAAERTDE